MRRRPLDTIIAFHSNNFNKFIQEIPSWRYLMLKLIEHSNKY